jgi:hypothetical protein
MAAGAGKVGTSAVPAASIARWKSSRLPVSLYRKRSAFPRMATVAERAWLPGGAMSIARSRRALNYVDFGFGD